MPRALLSHSVQQDGCRQVVIAEKLRLGAVNPPSKMEDESRAEVVQPSQQFSPIAGEITLRTRQTSCLSRRHRKKLIEQMAGEETAACDQDLHATVPRNSARRSWKTSRAFS